jgi:antitoxin PrlF
MESWLYRSGRNGYDLSMKAVVSEKGQVTIPKPLRDRLGIQPGEVLDFDEEEGRLVARKVGARDPVDAVYGILELDKSTDELLAELRGDPNRQ